MVKNKIKFFCSLSILLLACIFYVIIHGTKRLIITDFISFLFPNFPILEARKGGNFFVKNYLVDAFWFSSFLIVLSIIFARHYRFIALAIAIVLESFQKFIPQLGTFDFIDILLYIGICCLSLCVCKVIDFLLRIKNRDNKNISVNLREG